MKQTDHKEDKSIAEHAFKLLYTTGIYIKRTGRRCRKLLVKHVQKAYRFTVFGFKSVASRVCDWLQKKFFRILQGVQNTCRQAAYIAGLLLKGKFGQLKEELAAKCPQLRRGLKTAVHYIVPAACIAVTVLTIQFFMNHEFVLAVQYGDEFIGNISEESTFNQAIAMVKERLVFEDTKEELETPIYTVKLANKNDITDVYSLSDKIIQNTSVELVEACGLYIDGDFIGAVEDQARLRSLIQGMLDSYQDSYPDSTVEFVNDIQLKSGLFPRSGITNLSEVEATVTQTKTAQATYTVMAGDAPLTIAAKNDMSYSELRSLNPGIEESLLVGQELIISKAEPLLNVKVTKTEVYTEEIPYDTQTSNSSEYQKGTTKVVKDGVPGEKSITALVEYVDGVEISRTIINTEVVKEPEDEQVLIGTKAIQSVSTMRLGYPVPSHQINCGWLGYYGHYGVDFYAKTGTTVMASEAGTVVVSGWDRYYGYYVMIDHGNGMQTLYAHNSSLVVDVGDKVSRGELIAYSGDTGNTTGPHCHFEVLINGQRVNPMLYIG